MRHVQPELIEESKYNDILLIFRDNEHEYVASVLENVLDRCRCLDSMLRKQT